MSGFLYFVENGAKPPSHIASHPATINAVTAGPSGKSGHVLAPTGIEGPRDARLNLHTQTWMECEGFWLGWETAVPPKAEDLARHSMVAGYTVKLCDGWEVIVPVARKFPDGTDLPQAIKVGPNKTITYETLPRFLRLCEWGETIYRTVIADGEDMPHASLLDAAVEAISQNYLAGVYELTAMGQITTDNLKTIALVMVDWPAIWEDSQKKTPIDGGSS